MNQPSLYQRANQVQRRDAQQIINEYAGIMQWRLDGRDTLIDIGSGSGNVLMEFLHPILPKNYALLVGSDISKKMMGYASKCYANYERTEFKVLDIGCEQLPHDLINKFDHATSFYCLHWVQNQSLALRNIYQLLRNEGGDCLLVFLASHMIFEAYKLLAKNAKWSTYMRDVENFVAPLQYSADPKLEFEKQLAKAGFVDSSVELRNEVFAYEGAHLLKDNLGAVCPFLERMPAALHEDFYNDYMTIAAKLNLCETSTDVNGSEFVRFISPYKLIVAYARKGGAFVSSIFNKEHTTKHIQ